MAPEQGCLSRRVAAQRLARRRQCSGNVGKHFGQLGGDNTGDPWPGSVHLGRGSSSTNVIGAAASGKNSKALPNYIPANLLAKPDYDAHDSRVTLRWDNYPQNPPRSWNKPAPGTGNTVNAFAAD